MWTIAVLLLQSSSAKAFPVFTFTETFYPPASPSFASLTRNVELPNTFTLCSSSKQARFNNRGSFSVLGADGRQWLSVVFWQHPQTVIIWMVWNKVSYNLGALVNPKVNFWYHLCLAIEVRGKKVKASMNGETLQAVDGQQLTNIPKDLKVTFGRWDNFNSKYEQFEGSLTNLQMFSAGHDIAALSAEPCGIQGDLLAWHPEDWRVEGERWVLVDETGESVCDQGHNRAVAIPMEMRIHEAMDICRNKLNNSIIPIQNDQLSFETYISWYNNITNGRCLEVWTPYSDEETEGIFLNMNDGTEAKFLPWAAGQPDGGSNENNVRLVLQTSLYKDISSNQRFCSSCFLESSLLLRLDGLCEESYIGG